MAHFTGYSRFYCVMSSIGASNYIGSQSKSINYSIEGLPLSAIRNQTINKIVKLMEKHNLINNDNRMKFSDCLQKYDLGRLNRFWAILLSKRITNSAVNDFFLKLMKV